VDIGGALAEARSEAGMTITQVSERTRIRETIIRDIERDDYATCGGDFYARGHIRAIARVVGADPVPLITEYDAARMPSPEPLDPDACTEPNLFDHGEAEVHLPADLLPRLRRSAADWTAAVASRLAGDQSNRENAGAARARPATPHGSTATRGSTTTPGITGPLGITAAEAFRPAMPLELRRRRSPWTGLLALAVLAAVGALIYLLASGGSSHGNAPAKPRAHPRGIVAHHARASTLQPASTQQPAGTQHPAGTAATPAVTGPVRIASAAAFGPGGTGQGDDPSGAPLAVDGSAGTGWHTDWYATSRLGGLQSGTGLLLRLGQSATIAGTTIVLGAPPGGTIELRAGDTPSLADLPVVARVANPGGALTVHLSTPVRARYLLIWFTSLPPDSAGTYRASVYDVSLAGTA
jgi:hypothetical protein